MPSFVTLEPTNHCRLRCPLCPTGSGRIRRPRGFADSSAVERAIDEIAPFAFRISFVGYGEPFLHRDLLAMVHRASCRGVLTSVDTSGTLLKTQSDVESIVESGLSEILVSLDGATQESLEKYRRNAVLEEVLQGIRSLIETRRRRRRRSPSVCLQFVVMKHNEHEIPAIRRVARDLGVDRLRLKTCTSWGAPDPENYAPSDPALRRPTSRASKSFSRRCLFPWQAMAIDWDGTAVPCCDDWDESVPLGNVFQDGGVRSVWQGERYADFRRRISTDRAGIPLCRDCPILLPEEKSL